MHSEGYCSCCVCVCVCLSSHIIITSGAFFVLKMLSHTQQATMVQIQKFVGKGHIPLAVSGISILRLWNIQLTFDW